MQRRPSLTRTPRHQLQTPAPSHSPGYNPAAHARRAALELFGRDGAPRSHAETRDAGPFQGSINTENTEVTESTEKSKRRACSSTPPQATRALRRTMQRRLSLIRCPRHQSQTPAPSRSPGYNPAAPARRAARQLLARDGAPRFHVEIRGAGPFRECINMDNTAKSL
jgi:hypothetical protein